MSFGEVLSDSSKKGYYKAFQPQLVLRRTDDVATEMSSANVQSIEQTVVSGEASVIDI